MCGRARCTLRAEDIPRACHRNHDAVRTVHMDRYRPGYNVSPGANLPVIRRDDGSTGEGFSLQCMKWGLVPNFTKKTEKPDHYRMFNARCESISEKASFRRLVPKNRCLVAVEGFYEWKKNGSKKQPYYIHLKDGRSLVFAALYDSWENSEGEMLYTFTILTTSSSSALQWLHDRMPVILGDKESNDAWLSDASSSKYNLLLKPYENPDLVWYPVTTAMGSSSFDGPECIKEIKFKAEEKNPISKFFLTKGTKKEQDTKPEVLHDESKMTNKPTRLKEEPDLEEKTAVPSPAKDECDSKSSLSATPHESEVKVQTKRDYEEFVADSKLFTKSEKLPTGPMKMKKGNQPSSGDNQLSLFSYFKKS